MPTADMIFLMQQLKLLCFAKAKVDLDSNNNISTKRCKRKQ